MLFEKTVKSRKPWGTPNLRYDLKQNKNRNIERKNFREVGKAKPREGKFLEDKYET